MTKKTILEEIMIVDAIKEAIKISKDSGYVVEQEDGGYKINGSKKPPEIDELRKKIAEKTTTI